MKALITAVCLIGFVGQCTAWVTWINDELNQCQKTDQPCQNGGTCVMYSQSAYKCMCAENAYGKTCEMVSNGEEIKTSHVTKTYECHQKCEFYNQRGSLNCTQASVSNGDTCHLTVEPVASLLVKTGQIAQCTNPIQQAQLTDDSGWSASSSHSSCQPEYAKWSWSSSCNWASDTQFHRQWLQVYFAKDIIATRIGIKPRYNEDMWVKKAKFYIYSDIGEKWVYITGDDGKEKIFTVFGEEDRSSIREEPWLLDLNPHIIMSHLRVFVMEYNSRPAMRLEVWGCDYLAL